MAGALGVITTTVPMIVATGTTLKVMEGVFRDKKGRQVGSTHYHYRGKKAVSHRHQGGHLSHMHRGMRGYGRTRRTLGR